METNEQFDSVCCFNGISRSFEDSKKAKIFLMNVSDHLKTGGYFFGIVPDSSSIWSLAHKSNDGLHVKGELFTIDFFNEDFHHFGTKYVMTLGSTERLEEYLVHFPSFIKMAKDVDLVMLDITNLLEFYEEYK